MSGDFKVEYDPLSLLPGRNLRLRLSGKNFKVHLMGGWSRMNGVEDAAVDSFFGDIELDSKGISEIHALHAQSPVFQFHIGKNE